jgi:hypothetical protein
VAAFIQKWQLAEDEAALRAACAKVGASWITTWDSWMTLGSVGYLWIKGEMS